MGRIQNLIENFLSILIPVLLTRQKGLTYLIKAMFQQIWNLIQANQLDEAYLALQQLSITENYLINVAKLLEAEIVLRQGKFEKAITITNESLVYFSKRLPHLEELKEDRTGIGLNFLEMCLINCLYMRALGGQRRWKESWQYGQGALNQWNYYYYSRYPFLKIEIPEEWLHLPDEISSYLKVVEEFLGQKPQCYQLLDLLVPEGFTSKPFAPKLNLLKSPTPLVSVCIPTYCDGPWLKTTIDAVFENAGYENFEVIIVYQKKIATDTVEEFLQQPQYRNNPKLKTFIYDFPLGCENSKQVAYEHSIGEMIISLDAHVIPCRDFIAKTVKLFWENPEVSILNYGFTETRESREVKFYYYDEIPYHLNAIVAHRSIFNFKQMVYHKQGLYRRHCLMGAAFCIMRHVFFEIGGYLLKNYAWGDKALGMAAYLYGYTIYSSPGLIFIHKWHEDRHQQWKDTHRKTERFEYSNEVPAAALIVGYFYFSETYFERYYIPWIKDLCGPSFDFHWQKFLNQIDVYRPLKPIFWQKAVRSIKDYWLEYGPSIWPYLTEAEREVLYRDCIQSESKN